MKFLTTNEICKILKISRITLIKWQKKGIIKAFYTSKRTKFYDLDTLILSESSDLKTSNKKEVL